MGQQQTVPEVQPPERSDDEASVFHENFDDLSNVKKKSKWRRATSASQGRQSSNGYAGQLSKSQGNDKVLSEKGPGEGQSNASGRKYTKKKDKAPQQETPKETTDIRPKTAPAGRPWWKRKSSKKIHPVWQGDCNPTPEKPLGDLEPPQGRIIKNQAQTAIYKSCDALAVNEPPPKPPRVLTIKPAFSTPYLYEEDQSQYANNEDDEDGDCVQEIPIGSIGVPRFSSSIVDVLTLKTPRTSNQTLEPIFHTPRDEVPVRNTGANQNQARTDFFSVDAAPSAPAWTDHEPSLTARSSKKLSKLLKKSDQFESAKKSGSDKSKKKDREVDSEVTVLQRGGLSQAWDTCEPVEGVKKKKPEKSSKNDCTPVQQLLVGSNLTAEHLSTSESWASPVSKGSKLKPFMQPKSITPLPITDAITEDPQPRQRLHAKFLPPLERDTVSAIPTTHLPVLGALKPATLSRTLRSSGPSSVQSPPPCRPKTPTPGNSDESSSSSEDEEELPANVFRVNTAPAGGRRIGVDTPNTRLYQQQPTTSQQSNRHVLSVGLGVRTVSRQIARYQQIRSGTVVNPGGNVRKIFAQPQYQESSSESEQSEDSVEEVCAGNMEGTTQDNAPAVLEMPSKPWKPNKRSSVPENDDLVTALELYNYMNDGQLSPYLFDPTYMLLIDVRDPEHYSTLHINTAVHILDLKKRKLEPFSQFTIIVVYDEEGGTHASSNCLLRKTMDRLKEDGVEPCMLVGGFRCFHEEFPFLCTKKVVRTEKDRQSLLVPYPSCMLLRKLYLGRGDQATNPQIIANLGITHVINIGREHKCPFIGKVRYFPIAVDDTTSADLSSRFNRSNQFIHEAVSNRADAILVHCNLGASRSATLVIAYLMISRRWTLEDAHAFVKEHRPVISPNIGFLKQLQKLERDLYGKNLSDIDNIWR